MGIFYLWIIAVAKHSNINSVTRRYAPAIHSRSIGTPRIVFIKFLPLCIQRTALAQIVQQRSYGIMWHKLVHYQAL